MDLLSRHPARAPRRPPPRGILSRRGPIPPDPDIGRVQTAYLVREVAAADLAAAEGHLGPFHETTCHFRDALNTARRDWDRLRAELGSAALDAALASLPAAVLTLEGTGWQIVPIGGHAYAAEPLPPTPLAARLWRLIRLPHCDGGPSYVARLRDGSTRCDCAEWTYQVAGFDDAPPCKHVAALSWLGWLGAGMSRT